MGSAAMQAADSASRDPLSMSRSRHQEVRPLEGRKDWRVALQRGLMGHRKQCVGPC